MSDTPSFRLLLSRLAVGKSEDAAESLVKRYAGRLAALSAQKMTEGLQRRVSPEDVVQSVFATFFRRVNDGKLEIRDWESLWGLLARIATWRICRHAERHGTGKRAISKEMPLEDGGDVLDREPGPEQVLIVDDLREQCMNDLPERYRPIAMQILEGNTHEEIARALNTSISTVERVHRRLRECMTKLLAAEESA